MTIDPAQRLVVQPVSVVPSPASSGTDFHIDSEQTAWFNTVEQTVPFKIVVYPNGQDKTRQNAEIILVTAFSASTRPGTVTPVEVQVGSDLGATGTAVVTTVTPGGGGQNEVQSLTVDATDGSYTLSFGGQTTVDLTPDLPAAVVQDELEALSSIGTGNVTVTGPVGGPYTITFVGALANTNVAQITSDVTLLASQGMNEIQHWAVDGDGGTYRLSADGGVNWTGALAWNASAATVQTALTGLAAIGANNCLVTFDSTTGIYTVTFVGSKACTNMALLQADVASLTKATTHITTAERAQDGSPARTIQTGDLAEVALVSPGTNRPAGANVSGTTTETDLISDEGIIPAGSFPSKFCRLTVGGNYAMGATPKDLPRFKVRFGPAGTSPLNVVLDSGVTGSNVFGTDAATQPFKFVIMLYAISAGGGGLWDINADIEGDMTIGVLNATGGAGFVTGGGKIRTVPAGASGGLGTYRGYREATTFDPTIDNQVQFTVILPSNSGLIQLIVDYALLELL